MRSNIHDLLDDGDREALLLLFLPVCPKAERVRDNMLKVKVMECNVSGFSTADNKFLSIACRARMVSTRDNGVYTGSGLRGVIPYV
jgi:hypothetical protein